MGRDQVRLVCSRWTAVSAGGLARSTRERVGHRDYSILGSSVNLGPVAKCSHLSAAVLREGRASGGYEIKDNLVSRAGLELSEATENRELIKVLKRSTR